ncbi:MAG: carbohydrate kinase family protein [Candidatus Thorarchaeota archaeon]
MILAIGNINMDWICLLPHLPAPDEKLNIRELNLHPGGAAGNFAVSLARLGSEVALFGHVGDDAEGHEALQALQKEKVDTTRIILEKSQSTGFVIILVGEEGQTMKLRYQGANSQLVPEEITPKLLKGISVVYVASVSIPLAQKVAQVCMKVGIQSAIDVGEALLEQSLDAIRNMICSYHIAFMNATVFKRLFKKDATPETVHAEIGGTLETISVTLGAEGSLTATPELVFHTPAYKVKAIDTTGAGDAYAAGFLHFHQHNFSIKDVAKRAAACAALQIMQFGGRAGLPSDQEVEKFIKDYKENST